MRVSDLRGGTVRIGTILAILAMSSLFADRPATAQTFSTLHEFSDGRGFPQSALAEDADGHLWGTTLNGGAYGWGSIFVLTPNGLGGFTFAEPYSFTGGTDGANPAWTLVQATDGWMYGVVRGGSGLGGIFRIDTSGNTFEVVHAFVATDGWSPSAALMLGSDGLLYGTGYEGGAFGYGTVFAFDPASQSFNVIHNFTAFAGGPRGTLMEGTDGRIYGTATFGGAGFTTANHTRTYQGLVYRMDKSGANFGSLHAFTGTDGSEPSAGVIQLSDGFLYGTTVQSSDLRGVVFKVDTAGHNFKVLHHLTDAEGPYLYSGLTAAADGLLYGTGTAFTQSNDGTVFRLDTDGTTFELLHTFTNAEGIEPLASLLEGSDGFLYGTTQFYGAGNYGAVFQLNSVTAGISIVHAFVARDAFWSSSALTLGPGGFLYGTAGGGGSSGDGAVFKVDQSGSNYSILHSFSGPDGSSPVGPLIVGSDGFLYGTTHGAFGQANLGYGNVFRIDAAGSNFSVLYSFAGPDGDGPFNGVIQGADGFLYGTTSYGGSFDQGVVFRLSTTGQNFSVLHEFSVGVLYASLLQAADGMLYGATYNGGTNNVGSLYRLTTSGSGFEVIHSFSSDAGSGPFGNLMQLAGGALYGTTFKGSPNDAGVVYKLDPSGSNFSVIHAFDVSDGQFSYAPLLAAADGFLYGTTYWGGSSGKGTVFRLDSGGGNFSTVHNFSGADGSDVQCGLIQAPGGALFGTALHGGTLQGGAVFRIDPAGARFKRR